jgi:hypothetical protein
MTDTIRRDLMENLTVIKADLVVDASRLTTEPGTRTVYILADDPTSEERHKLLETSGTLDFWNDPAEDVYSEDDGEPI